MYKTVELEMHAIGKKTLNVSFDDLNPQVFGFFLPFLTDNSHTFTCM